MKQIAIYTITLYQKFISPLLHQLLGIKSGCRNYPSCSEYAKESFEHYGVEKGLVLSIRRLLSCQPFFSL